MARLARTAPTPLASFTPIPHSAAFTQLRARERAAIGAILVDFGPPHGDNSLHTWTQKAMSTLIIIKALARNSVLRRVLQWLATVLALLIISWRAYFTVRKYTEPAAATDPPAALVTAAWFSGLWLAFVYLRHLWRQLKLGYHQGE